MLIMTECIKAATCFSLLGHSMNICCYQYFIHRLLQITAVAFEYMLSVDSSILIRHITPEKENFPNSLWKPNRHLGMLCQLKRDLPLSAVDHFVLKNISHRSKSCPYLWQSLGRINCGLS